MGLSTREQIRVAQQESDEEKSTGMAYTLWFFLGVLGTHRFYLGRRGSGAAMLALSIAGLATLPVGLGVFLIVAVCVWVTVDAFLLPGMVDRHNEDARRRLAADAPKSRRS